ncbi:homoserine dehydrogenase [Thiomicrospira cyclica]|uniref:Homoserine dehydrogenase n=1 Tax=Thiomicrospira cyclica (strain DSM 14477 / JCM 11371 / ALM1) TaxID=717773 RepID=F6DCA5_THICA|nr:homoserine dehydrogenase [Thiomicrospira cyclica]AEG31491.1 Homoserine dehydrogenase [Thiomicrospira cyclica ALM1]
MQPIRLGIIGLGTVASGLVSILATQAQGSRSKIAQTFEIKKIAVRDLSRPRQVDTGAIALTADPFELVQDPDIDVIVELMGGTTLARDLVELAIRNGKHIVTANKALLALYGNELFAQAEQQGVQIYFEAAVAGGVPIIKALREGLIANDIDWLAGIINGTGNYILTDMKKPGAVFEQVLAKAQELGYAEADPTYDVEGIDAAHKLTILASLAFGIELAFSRVYTEGISQVSADDVRFAQAFGYEIKHLGIAAKEPSGYSLRVHPTLVPKDVLLAEVNGVMNAVLVHGDQVGATMLYGPGAGGAATASAVMADLYDLGRMWQAGAEHSVPPLGRYTADLKTSANILNIDAIHTGFYVRCLVEDHPGMLAAISQTLADFDISIEHLHQEPISHDNQANQALLAFTTNKVFEATFNQALAKLEALDGMLGKINKIRMSDF